MTHDVAWMCWMLQKRIEDLSAPAKKRTGRKFATDDEERHCRFQPKRIGAKKSSSSNRDDDDYGGDKRNDFIARMEAAEKSKQKARRSLRSTVCGWSRQHHVLVRAC